MKKSLYLNYVIKQKYSNAKYERKRLYFFQLLKYQLPQYQEFKEATIYMTLLFKR